MEPPKPSISIITNMPIDEEKEKLLALRFQIDPSILESKLKPDHPDLMKSELDLSKELAKNIRKKINELNKLFDEAIDLNLKVVISTSVNKPQIILQNITYFLSL